MKTKFSKTLSIILAMLMLVSGLEVTGFASNLTNNSEVSFDNIENEKPNIESEIISKRTAYSKVFSTDDGGYYSVVSATPIHIKDENGEFQNIEEPLVELSTEDAITEFIAYETELYNTETSFNTYGLNTGTADMYEDNTSLTVKSFGSSAETGNFVQGTSAGNTLVCVKPNIVEKNVLITSAKINASAFGNGKTSNNYVLSKEIVSAWDESSTECPDIHNNYFDCVMVAQSSTTTSVEWDITNLMNSWILNLKENYGIALTTNKSKCNVGISKITLNYYYREISEFDDNFTYETIDMGNAGIVYINHFSCTPTLIINDIGIDGEKAPVQISHIYSAKGDYYQNSCGNNFRLNYNSTLKFSGASTYSWTTVEGETIDFVPVNTTDTVKSFLSVDSKSTYTLSLLKDSTSNSFKYGLFENITIQNNYTDEKYTFESHANIGYLNSIYDGSENNNKITIDYTFTDDTLDEEFFSNDIISITDGANRKYVFNYAENGSFVYLESIDVLNADDDYICVGNDDESEEYRIEYSYLFNNDTAYLQNVIRTGETNSASYTYDSQNRLSTISNGSKTLTLNYTSDTSNKLTSYHITNSVGSLWESVSINSSNVYMRVFTKNNTETRVIRFNEYYETVYLEDYDGTTINGINRDGTITYLPSLNSNINLVLNGDFESLDNRDFPLNWLIANPDAEITIDNNEINNKTLEIEGNLLDSAGIYQQINAPDGTSFKKNTSYVYGGRALADNAIASNGNHTFGIFIYDAINDGGTLVPNNCISHFNFDYTLNEIVQQKVSYFTLEEDTPALFIYVCFDYNYDDSAFFDDIQLYEFEQTPNVIKPVEYNANNSVTSAKLNSKNEGNKYIGSIYQYDTSCNLNYLSSIEDERGVTTYYTYDSDNGRLVSVATSAETSARNFQYTAAGLLSSVQQTVTNTITGNTVAMKTDYGYTDGMLTSVLHNGYGYTFTYDDYGNVATIKISGDETPLVLTTYANGANHHVGKIEYANGDYIQYNYDPENPSLITKINFVGHSVEGKEKYQKSIEYSYDNDGNLLSVEDNRANIEITYGSNSYTYKTLDNNTIIYKSTIDGYTGNTVENFKQFDYEVDNTINPSIQTRNDMFETTFSSLQTLEKYKNVSTSTGAIERQVFETYTYDKESTYDEFMRPTSNNILAQYKTVADNIVINSEEIYDYHSIGNKETTLISSYRTIKSVGRTNTTGEIEYDNNGHVVDESFIDLTYSYDYDNAGNISRIILTDNITHTETVYNVFKYDDANQLIFEYSSAKNSCICYSYDAGGNITEKRVYDLSAYDMINETIYSDAVYEHYIFTYDETYKDILVSVSSSEETDVNLIEYDALGNPLNYDAADGTFEWNGRLLTAFETNGEGNRYEYEYDANGLRTRKIIYDKNLINGSSSEYTYTQTGTIEYVWADGILKGVSITNTVQNTNFFMNIIYDENGIAQGYVGITGTPYYFVRDPLGNITSIIAATDDVTIEVKYDAWGNPTFPSASDSILEGVVTAFVCSFNPSTYKGYLYDFETGLYYCGSRYYSPVWSRFINMDDATVLNLTRGNTIGANLYAYCNNNPVNFTDRRGYLCEQWSLEYPNYPTTVKMDISNTHYNDFLFVPSTKREYNK